jgi:hypothetical protein
MTVPLIKTRGQHPTVDLGASRTREQSAALLVKSATGSVGVHPYLLRTVQPKVLSSLD